MPIHEFGPLKRIEDAEREVEEGKAKEINRAKPVKQIQKKKPKVKPKAKPKKPQKREVKKTSHPLIHGTLDIEEEEL